jgi:hypothetical protein
LASLFLDEDRGLRSITSYAKRPQSSTSFSQSGNILSEDIRREKMEQNKKPTNQSHHYFTSEQQYLIKQTWGAENRPP